MIIVNLTHSVSVWKAYSTLLEAQKWAISQIGPDVTAWIDSDGELRAEGAGANNWGWQFFDSEQDALESLNLTFGDPEDRAYDEDAARAYDEEVAAIRAAVRFFEDTDNDTSN